MEVPSADPDDVGTPELVDVVCECKTFSDTVVVDHLGRELGPDDCGLCYATVPIGEAHHCIEVVLYESEAVIEDRARTGEIAKNYIKPHGLDENGLARLYDVVKAHKP